MAAGDGDDVLLLAPQSPPGGHPSPAAEPADGEVDGVGPSASVGVTPPEKLKRGGGPSARGGEQCPSLSAPGWWTSPDPIGGGPGCWCGVPWWPGPALRAAGGCHWLLDVRGGARAR